ncbi:cobalamin biosynthesis protein CobQ [beta proteobacterium AAP51]|nr:cobalamin biosynthesis protein CobQ [beta proteobacterium AAP51]
MTRTLIVWGTTSGAGKSWLATALCRVAARRGLNVAPYKAQNMSNNARVVACGAPAEEGLGEIGSAQYFQALAARVRPHTDMNPVLLKPESDTASQVVVHGQARAELKAVPWRERSALLAVEAQAGFQRLAARHELIVVEGAGSPAEINLAPQDYVNLGTARWAAAAGPAAALLVSDIDRGGSFAHVYGTWALLPEDLRPLLQGFVLNRFRGDAALLAPGPQQLQALTGVPLAGVLPLLRGHGLPEEDGLLHADEALPGAGGAPVRLRVAVIAPPHLSNLDEFLPLAQVPGVRLVWARTPAQAEGADWLVLPGSKQASSDLAWLRAQGLHHSVLAHAAAGRPVLGVCGGLQQLGQTLHDPEGHDGQPVQHLPGLGLLPLHTRFGPGKRLRAAPVHFTEVQGPWQALAGVQAQGYEIRCGHTEAVPGHAVLHDAQGQAIGWQRGSVLGVYAHGLFEQVAVLRALFGAQVPTLDQACDTLADHVEAHFDAALLRRLLGA